MSLSKEEQVQNPKLGAVGDKMLSIRRMLTEARGWKQHNYSLEPYFERFNGFYLIEDLYNNKWEPTIHGKFENNYYSFTREEIRQILLKWRNAVKRIYEQINDARKKDALLDLIALLRYTKAESMDGRIPVTEKLVENFVRCDPVHFPCPACDKKLANQVSVEGMEFICCVGGYDKAATEYREPTKGYYALKPNGDKFVTRVVVWSDQHSNNAKALWDTFNSQAVTSLTVFYHATQQYGHAHLHAYSRSKSFKLVFHDSKGSEFAWAVSSLCSAIINQVITMIKMMSRINPDRKKKGKSWQDKGWQAKHFFADIPLPVKYAIDALTEGGELTPLAYFSLICSTDMHMHMPNASRQEITDCVLRDMTPVSHISDANSDKQGAELHTNGVVSSISISTVLAMFRELLVKHHKIPISRKMEEAMRLRGMLPMIQDQYILIDEVFK
jgi:hypothetical protein